MLHDALQRRHARVYAKQGPAFSAAAGVSHDASDERCQPGEQPWQRVQVLVTSACRRGPPAGRARPGPLHPSDVEKKYPNPSEEPKRGAADRRLGSHQCADDSYRRENENAERHEAERGRTSEKRPRPEPAAVGDMSTKRRLKSCRP